MKNNLDGPFGFFGSAKKMLNYYHTNIIVKVLPGNIYP